MKTVVRKFSVLLIPLFFIQSNFADAQIVTNTSVTALQLAQALVGPGAIVLNPQITGMATSYGTFTNGFSTNIGIGQGIILTSGNANIPSSNTASPWSTAYYSPGDPLLAFAGITNDACRFEFDVVAYDSSMTFNYVFGSEEYNDWVGTSFNDAFGFFISGPGIVGQQNIALLPGGAQVTIGNVNCGNNGQYYTCNDWWNPTSGGCTNQCPPNQASTTIEYDGFTVMLTAQADVTPCDTYHLILVIADIADAGYDSGVLIGNLIAGTNISTTVSDSLPGLDNTSLMEGCTTGQIQLKKQSITNGGACSLIDTSNCATDSLCYKLVTSGNAIEGVDYLALPDTMCFGMDTVMYIDIIPIADGIFEPGVDTIIIDLIPVSDTTNCPGAVLLQSFQVKFFLIDQQLFTTPNTILCIGQSVDLITSSNLPVVTWSPPTGLSCTTCLSPTATPTSSTLYTVTAALGNCSLSQTVMVDVDFPQAIVASNDTAMCLNDSVQLIVTGATNYVWAPTTSLTDPNIPNPIAFPTTTTTYTVTGLSPCGITTDSVVVTVHPLPIADAYPDTIICPWGSTTLYASGGIQYLWFGDGLLTDTGSMVVVAPPVDSTVYMVIVSNEFFCVDTAYTVVDFFPIPQAYAGQDVTIHLYDSVQIVASGGVSWIWDPSYGLSDTTIGNPWANPEVSTLYHVIVTNANGCVDDDTVWVFVDDKPYVYLPNAFSPNEDGINDLLKIIHQGVFELEDFRIYNRWGELVYQTNDIKKGWNGLYKNEPAPIGVYVYYIAGHGHNNQRVSMRGNVTLLK